MSKNKKRQSASFRKRNARDSVTTVADNCVRADSDLRSVMSLSVSLLYLCCRIRSGRVSFCSLRGLRGFARSHAFAATIEREMPKKYVNKHRVDFSTILDFESITDTFLESLEEKLEILEESEALQDIHYSQGVLTIDMGIEGIWVINKQSPNKQLWLSSPKSGPVRFHLNAIDGKWRSTKCEGDLISMLNRELSSAANIRIVLE